MVVARWSAHGDGEPITLVVPGLGATVGEARIPASGLPGTRVVVTLPGHSEAPDAPPGYWTYRRVADDVLAVADEVGAHRAIGVSLGAGALTRVVAEHPRRFDQLALLLPASLDQPRAVPAMWTLARLGEAVREAEDDGGARLRELVEAEVPAGVDVGDHVSRRVAALLRLGDALDGLPEQSAVEDASVLGAVSSDVLVVGASEDPLHPAEVAKSVAAAFPAARWEILESSAPMLTHRRELRSLLTGFFGA